MPDLPPDGPPPREQGRPPPHVRARAFALRRLPLLRALCREDEMPGLERAGDIRSATERAPAFQAARRAAVAQVFDCLQGGLSARRARAHASLLGVQCPIPKFAEVCSTVGCELRDRRTLDNV